MLGWESADEIRTCGYGGRDPNSFGGQCVSEGHASGTASGEARQRPSQARYSSRSPRSEPTASGGEGCDGKATSGRHSGTCKW